MSKIIPTWHKVELIHNGIHTTNLFDKKDLPNPSPLVEYVKSYLKIG